MKRVFNVSIKKTRNSIKENSFQPHKSTETQPRPETSQPVEDAEWRPVWFLNFGLKLNPPITGLTMMSIEAISTPNAPAAVGPYSQAVRCGDMLYCSGQVPLDPQTGQMVPGDTGEQAVRVMENLRAVLAAAGVTFSSVVMTTIFLTDMGDFSVVNKVYERFFDSGVYPARATVEVSKLPRDARVEIAMIAKLPSWWSSYCSFAFL